MTDDGQTTNIVPGSGVLELYSTTVATLVVGQSSLVVLVIATTRILLVNTTGSNKNPNNGSSVDF